MTPAERREVEAELHRLPALRSPRRRPSLRFLGPLQSNAGPTPTHALRLGSPAIDAIPAASCTYDHDGDPLTPEVALTKDQRGGMRPREGDGSAPSGCDIGAYEVAPCADGLDNDGDGLVDFDGGATAGLTPLASPDPTCTTALGAAEAVAPPSPGCGVGPELRCWSRSSQRRGAAARRSRPALDGSPDTREQPFEWQRPDVGSPPPNGPALSCGTASSLADGEDVPRPR